MWKTVPLIIVHEKSGGAEQWRLKACDDHGRSLCSRVYLTSEAAALAQQGLAAILRGLDGELALRALDHWVRFDDAKRAPAAKGCTFSAELRSRLLEIERRERDR